MDLGLRADARPLAHHVGNDRPSRARSRRRAPSRGSPPRWFGASSRAAMTSAKEGGTSASELRMSAPAGNVGSAARDDEARRRRADRVLDAGDEAVRTSPARVETRSRQPSCRPRACSAFTSPRLQHGDAVLQGALDGAAGGHCCCSPLAFKGFLPAMLLAAGHGSYLLVQTRTFFVCSCPAFGRRLLLGIERLPSVLRRVAHRADQNPHQRGGGREKTPRPARRPLPSRRWRRCERSSSGSSSSEARCCLPPWASRPVERAAPSHGLSASLRDCAGCYLPISLRYGRPDPSAAAVMCGPAPRCSRLRGPSTRDTRRRAATPRRPSRVGDAIRQSLTPMAPLGRVAAPRRSAAGPRRRGFASEETLAAALRRGSPAARRPERRRRRPAQAPAHAKRTCSPPRPSSTYASSWSRPLARRRSSTTSASDEDDEAVVVAEEGGAAAYCELAPKRASGVRAAWLHEAAAALVARSSARCGPALRLL